MSNPMLNRREFAWQASSGVCGLLTGGLVFDGRVMAQERDPAEKRLVLLGLNALARAHKMSYFTDGHRGASLVSAHLLCEENHLPAPARSRIEQLFDLNWAASPLCAPFPEESPAPEQIVKISEALAEGSGVLREVGHNSIFASLAIKGFRLLPSAATPRRIEGVCKLIRSIQPWRDIPPDEAVNPPLFSDAAAASTFVLREASAALDNWKGYGQGFAGHMLTFGQALVEMAAAGDVEVAESCRTAFRKYVTLTRQGPDAEAKKMVDRKPSPLRPTGTDYWKQRGDKELGIGHVFKYPYSYYELMRLSQDDAVKQELEAKAYLLF